MQYNVLENSLCTVNNIVGDMSLDFNELNSIVKYEEVPVVNVTTSGVLSIDFDLGLRLHIDKMEYMFEASSTISGSVASYIDFQYKNEVFDTEYISLQTYISSESNVYYTVFSGTSSAPRYIRLNHIFTTITGSLYGVRALNNDTIVDFGYAGEEYERSMEIIKNGAENIEVVPIYNSGDTIADAYINIEPTFTDLDQAVFLSLSTLGPWISTIDNDYIVAGSNNWEYGRYYNSELGSANELIISGYEDDDSYYTSIYDYGTYETKIFEKTEQDYLRIIVDRASSDDGDIIIDSDDTCDTIHIRSSNVPPKSYSVYRQMYTWYSSYVHYLSFRDTWLENDEIKYTNSSASFLSTDRYKDFNKFSCVFDTDTGRWAGYAIADSNSASTYGQTWLFNNSSDSSSSTLTISQNDTRPADQDFNLIDMKLDSLGGFWVYLYSKGYRSTDWCNNTGYYLAYFDSTFTEKFKWYESQKYIGGIDIDYDNNYLWYTNIIDNSVTRINNTGIVSLDYKSVEHTQSMGSVAVFPDGNAIYSNDGSLYRLGSDGAENDTYDLDDLLDDDITYITLDGDGSEAIWVCTGTSVSRVYITDSSNGRIDFSVSIVNIVRARAVYGGLWVTCFNALEDDNTTTYYVSKENRRIEHTKVLSQGSPGLNEVGYTDLKYISFLPIDIDTTWKDLSWKKVGLNNYLSPEDRYYQVKLTLRPQKIADRYDFIDNDTPFVNDDYFIQDSTTPNNGIWESWSDFPSIDRVHVDTEENELIIDKSEFSTENGFIQTKQRLVTSKSSSNTMEVRIKYRFGDGNTGAESGNTEYIYLYGYPVDTNNIGEYICAYLYIPIAAATSNSRVYTGINDSWSYTNMNSNLNLYDGTLRLYGNSSNNLYGQVASVGSTSFTGTYRSGWQQAGEKWYWKIIVNKASSKLYIENFEVLQGENYYYTETPHVRGIYTQELIKLENIYPNNSKDMYLKIQADQTLDISNNCEADVKVRWRVPIQ